jgi:hypothetical protein
MSLLASKTAFLRPKPDHAAAPHPSDSIRAAASSIGSTTKVTESVAHMLMWRALRVNESQTYAFSTVRRFGGNMQNNTNNATRFTSVTADRSGILSEIDLKILWVARTLTNIDFEFEAEFFRLEKSRLEGDQKQQIRDAIASRHRARREPYAKLLRELQDQQRRQSLAA